MNTPHPEQIAYTQEGYAEVWEIKLKENKTQPVQEQSCNHFEHPKPSQLPPATPKKHKPKKKGK